MSTGTSPIIYTRKLEEERTYWMAKLSVERMKGNVPLDYQRPAVYSPEISSLALTVPEDLCRRLFKITDNASFLLYTTFLAALKIYLHKSTGNDLIIVGSPARINRDKSSARPNALAIIDHVDSRMSFRQLLGNVRQSLIEAYKRQSYRIESIIQDLELDHIQNQCPLFDIAMAFSDLHGPIPEIRNDLTILFDKIEDSISSAIQFNKRLFSAATISRFAKHLIQLLRDALENTEAPISELKMLGEAERHLEMIEWNDTQADLPEELRIHRLFQQQVTVSADAVAVCFGDQQLSYSVLDSRASQLANYLVQSGINTEDIVAVFLENSPELIVSLIASLKAGAAYLPLDTSYPADRLGFILNDARPHFILTTESLLSLLPASAATVICLDAESERIAEYPSVDPSTVVLAENLAYVIYTSGSTGRPKGVQAIHSSLTNLAVAQSAVFGICSESSLLQFASLSFDASVSEIFTALISGARLVLESADRLHDLGQLMDLIKEQKISVVTLPPTMLGLIDPEILAEVDTVVSAGEQCSDQLASRHQSVRTFLNAYGPTEATVCATIDERRAGKALTIGRAMSNVEVYVRGEGDEDLGIGMAGELLIGGAGVTRGYLNRPEQTAERFVPDSKGGKAGQRLYRTGDVVSYREDGRIEYQGRTDTQVKVRGARIELGEIERVMVEDERVREVAVVLKEEEGEKRLVGYYVEWEGQEVSEGEVRERLKQKLTRQMIPSAIVKLKQMPVTPNGKVDRKQLARMRDERSGKEEKRAARTETEERVIGIWKEVLGLEAVGIDEDFFDLGGHSLLATQVISRVREVFQVEVPAQQLFLEPTVEGLAIYIDSATNNGANQHDLTIKPVTDDRNLPLSFAQQRLWFLDQLEPGSRVYNVGMAIRLTGRLKIGVLEQCLNETVRRHQSLRTNFVEIDGQPIQVINKITNLPIHLVELRHVLWQADYEVRDKLIERLVSEEGARSFDLAKGQLLRVTLLRLTNVEQALLLTMHHIVSDGWSMGLLTREIASLYESFSTGSQSALPELTIQYADFAAWQRARLDGEILDNHLAYWKKQLSGELPRIDLPTDRPRSATRSFRGATESTVFPIALSRSLKAASKQEEVTLFMTLLAAFKTLLFRYTGQEDVIVGTGIANRNRGETEEMIGFFVNMLVLRTDLSNNPTFKETLARVRKVMLGAYAHEDLPFEKLVEVLRPNRKASTTPLFQVVFVLHNLPPLSLSLPGITLTPINLDSELTHFDMTVEIGDEKDGLLVTVTYNTDLFDRSTINRFIRHYETLLIEVAKDLEVRLLDIPLSLEGLESRTKTAATLDSSYRNDRFTFNLNQ